jgi:MobA/VirD2-like, nuclease domain
MRFKVPAKQPASFKASALYLAGLIRGKSPHRVEFVEVRNLPTTDPLIASSMMDAVASKSVRCKQPQYHFIITFDPKDAEAGKVTKELKQEIAQRVIEDMELTEHQALVYSHQDTDHPHLHFLVNRVHPTEHLAYSRHNDGKRLKEVVRERAIEFDLNVLKDRQRSRAMDRVDDLSDIGPAPSDAEYWRARREGRDAHTPFTKEQGKELRSNLKGYFYDAKNWDQLSAELQGKGFTLERKGQGLVLTNGERYAKLSDMGKGIRLSEMEERFGEEFDSYVARQAGELSNQLDTPDKDRRTIEAMDASEDDTGKLDPVLRADLADMDYRYWTQVESSYRASKGRIKSSERFEQSSRKYRDKQKGWLNRREDGFLEMLSNVYHDPKAARSKWSALEKKHGVSDAGRLVRENPMVLGKVIGVDILNGRGAGQAKAKRMVRYLHERRQKWKAAKESLNVAQGKLDKAKHKTQLAFREYEHFVNIVGDDARLKQILLEKIRTRTKYLSRVTDKAIRKSKLTKERQEQLVRAYDMQQARQKVREKERAKQRARSKGLDIDLD